MAGSITNIPSGFRVETELLGLEKITWLVHPCGNVRAILRIEWMGPGPAKSQADSGEAGGGAQ